MRLFILSCLLLCSALAAEEDLAPVAAPAQPASKLPAEAKTLVDHEAAAEKALRAKLEADIAKLHTELAAKLKPCEEHAMHHSDLDGAEAVKAEIASLAVSHTDSSAYMIISADKAAKLVNCAFDAGNCPGLLSGDIGATCAYRFPVDQDGSYYVYGLLTAAASRPCNLLFDGQKADKAFKDVTGTWDQTGLQWFRYGPYALSKGDHLMEIKALGNLPNFRGFAISASPALTLGVDAFDAKTSRP